jgi:hypothetical protein
MTRLGAIIDYMLSSYSLSVMVMMLTMPDMYMFAVALQEER